MGWPSGGGRRRRSVSAAALLLLLLLLLDSAALRTALSHTTHMPPGTCTSVAPEDGYSWDPGATTAAARRGLVGPGSSPPTCRSRCGGCHPCRPVHVAIQPGRSFLLEYYPEAWRCKCGNKLFMP